MRKGENRSSMLDDTLLAFCAEPGPQTPFITPNGCAELRGDVRGEWDDMKQHDVVFLLTVRPPDQATLAQLRSEGAEPSPADTHGLVYVRGAEVIEVTAFCST